MIRWLRIMWGLWKAERETLRQLDQAVPIISGPAVVFRGFLAPHQQIQRGAWLRVRAGTGHTEATHQGDPLALAVALEPAESLEEPVKVLMQSYSSAMVVAS